MIIKSEQTIEVDLKYDHLDEKYKAYLIQTRENEFKHQLANQLLESVTINKTTDEMGRVHLKTELLICDFEVLRDMMQKIIHASNDGRVFALVNDFMNDQIKQTEAFLKEKQ